MTNSTKLARFFIAAFCGLCLRCSGSEASDDQAYIDLVADDLGLDRGALSLMAAGLLSTGASSGNITNDVAAILELLNNVYRSNGPALGVISYGTSQVPLSSWLKTAFGDNWTDTSAGTASGRRSAYLYQIRELLKSIPTNSMDRLTDAFLDFTKEDGGLTLRETIEDIDAQTYYSWEQLYGIYGSLDDYLPPLLSTARGVSNYLASFEYSDGLWHTHIDDTQFSDLLSSLNAIESSTPFHDSSWLNFDDNLSVSLSRIISHLSLIEYNTGHSDNILSTFLPDIFLNSQHIDGDLHDIIEGLSSYVASNSAASYSELASETSSAYAGAEYSDPTNAVDWVNIPAQIAQDADTSDLEDTAQDAGDALGVRLSAFEALVPSGNAEIVVIPEFTVGGIHVREYRASLDTSITSVAHAVMVFIWYVMLFVALFRLGEGEFAFYASLGRNWSMSGGFHQKGD